MNYSQLQNTFLRNTVLSLSTNLFDRSDLMIYLSMYVLLIDPFFMYLHKVEEEVGESIYK